MFYSHSPPYSKFRNVFANYPRKTEIFEGVRPTRIAWDFNLCAASSRWIAVASEATGTIAIYPLHNPQEHPLMIFANRTAVLCLEFDPFCPNILAATYEDCTTKIWRILDEPQGHITHPVQVLRGNKRKVGVCKFNPVTQSVLMTGASDFQMHLWDTEYATIKFSFESQLHWWSCLDWNYNGSLLLGSNGKHFQLIDPRAQEQIEPVSVCGGVRTFRCLWLGKNENYFATVGFSKMASREIKLWDRRKIDSPIHEQTLDNYAGYLMPFYDEDSDILFLAGKGDGHISWQHVWVDQEPNKILFHLGSHKSNEAAVGACALPRRNLEIHNCEIIRLYKLTKTQVQPLKVCVPRKNDMFQQDLFPDCRSDVPAITKESWFEGENVSGPKLASLEEGYVPSTQPPPNFILSEDHAEPPLQYI